MLFTLLQYFSVLIELLHACAESNAPPKYEELVMKCLWKIVKTFPNWAADLDYDTILLEVHRFLKVCLMVVSIIFLVYSEDLYELIFTGLSDYLVEEALV